MTALFRWGGPTFKSTIQFNNTHKTRQGRETQDQGRNRAQGPRPWAKARALLGEGCCAVRLPAAVLPRCHSWRERRRRAPVSPRSSIASLRTLWQWWWWLPGGRSRTVSPFLRVFFPLGIRAGDDRDVRVMLYPLASGLWLLVSGFWFPLAPG